MKLQGVIFDLDGVITDSAHLHFQAWQQIAVALFRQTNCRSLRWKSLLRHWTPTR